MSTAVKIQEAALRRFAAQGYAATSLREIAADCGIRKSSIYAHFPSKEGLFKRLMQTSVFTEMEFARERLQRPVPAAEALKGLLDSVPERFKLSAPLRFWLHASYVPPPALATEIRGYTGMYYSGLSSIVGLALENGLDAREHKKELLATAYLGILQGLYAALLQDHGETPGKTMTALWEVYQCAFDL